ncbi:MAG: ROK family transcriptional regulator [Clostridiales bacterium]|nr:ROK family transcriptional regulator [Clostridiales bacterium]
MATYNTAELRRQNRNRVFRYIYSAGHPVTKQDIAQALSLSLPTVGQNLKELQEADLLEFQGTFDSTGGRKPRAIGVSNNVRLAIGVYIGHQRIHLACINIRAQLLCSQRVTRPLTNDDEYADFLAQAIEDFIRTNNIDTNRLLGVGIAVCGVPDMERGVAGMSPMEPVSELDLNRIASRIPYPVQFENDANAGGLATWWVNPEKKNMVYLFLHRGIGGAMLLGGETYHGSTLHGGEFGHMTIVPGGRQCGCGQKGCLEAYCSTNRISEDLGISIETFFEGLQNGNEEYQKLWKDYLDHLAIGINNIHMVLDCQTVLGGQLGGYIGPYLYDLRQRLQKLSCFETDGSYCTVSSFGYWSTCVGAALCFVNQFISQI